MIITRRDGKETRMCTFRNAFEEPNATIIDAILDDGATRVYVLDDAFVLCFGAIRGIAMFDRGDLVLLSPIDKDESDMYEDMYNANEELFDRLKHRGSAALEMITNACAYTRPI